MFQPRDKAWSGIVEAAQFRLESSEAVAMVNILSPCKRISA
jgi:hypothetical protein